MEESSQVRKINYWASECRWKHEWGSFQETKMEKPLCHVCQVRARKVCLAWNGPEYFLYCFYFILSHSSSIYRQLSPLLTTTPFSAPYGWLSLSSGMHSFPVTLMNETRSWNRSSVILPMFVCCLHVFPQPQVFICVWYWESRPRWELCTCGQGCLRL